MKKSVLIVIISAAGIAIGLSSPLFYETTVDESLPGRLNAIEDGLTLDEFISMDYQKQQSIVEKMPDDVQEMIMGQAATTTREVSEGMAEPGTITVLRTGMFEGLLGHDAVGVAKILDVSDSSYLRFEDFQVTNGPDLRVYLTNDSDVKTGHHLDKLKGSKGDQNYLLDGVDWQKYDTVVVYCQPFGVHFGQALLTMG